MNTARAHYISIMSPLLIQEPPLQVLPSLAIKIGLNEAIVLQQLHYLLREPRFGRRIAEHQWIFNTVEQWIASYFPFWSVRTMKTIFTNLAKMKLILTCQPEGRVSRRKYYRIDLEKLEQICEGTKIARSMVQESSLPIVQKTSLPITKTTSKDFSKDYLSKESKETSALPTRNVLASPDETFPAMWKEDKRTKEEKLATTKVPKDYPSERTFNTFIESLDAISTYRGDSLYSELCDNKWHDWTGRNWRKIKDWKAYVMALETKLNSHHA